VQRHRHFNLLSLNQPRQIGVNQTTLHRIDLTIVKHHFADADTFDIDRENRVSSGFRAKDCSQITQRSNGGNSFRATAINRNGHHPSRRARRASFLPRPSRTFACTLKSFFSAMISPYKLSATRIHRLQMQAFSICNLWIPVADGLRLSHQCLPF
jgi:hypothetical protein